MIDGTNGNLSHKNLAQAKMNSNWACDPQEMRMLVVGDVGRACLYDISMEAHDEQMKNPSDMFRGNGKNTKGGANGKKKMTARYTSPPKYARFQDQHSRGASSMGGKMPMKWPIVKNWFNAHRLYKMEPSYVVSAKFVTVARVYVTGTTHGEVKLWDNQHCECLGIVNSPSWCPHELEHHLSHHNDRHIEEESDD
jgi:hypothetical protein